MRLLIFILPAILCSGCLFNRCANRMCGAMPPYAYFRIVDGKTGADLFFGDSARYAWSDLRAYYFQDNEKRRFPVSAGASFTTSDSFLYFSCSEGIGPIHLELSAADTDTLDVGFLTTREDCCSSTRITGLQYNGIDGESAEQKGAFVLRKY